MEWIKIISPTLLMLIGGILTWVFKSKIEELRATEEKLTEQRRTVYREILEPYIQIFADPKGEGAAKALKKITSFDYRRTAFDLNFFGSDQVVRAYNSLMQHFYKAEETGQQDMKQMFHLWACFLLEIRKSLGNKKTQLDKLDMLRGMIKDMDRLV